MATKTAQVEVIHYVWVTTVTNVYVEALVGRLVRRGWGVRPMGSSLCLHDQEHLSAVVAMAVTRAPKDDKDEVTPARVLEEVRDVLRVLGIKYHSVIVTETIGCTWVLGNVTLTEAKKAEEAFKKTIN